MNPSCPTFSIPAFKSGLYSRASAVLHPQFTGTAGAPGKPGLLKVPRPNAPPDFQPSPT